jgi:hemolysin activation/secretion protein
LHSRHRPRRQPARACRARPRRPETFRLNDVRLKGVAALDEQELHQLAAPYLGRDVNLAELQALAQAITAQYREHGYFLAQAIVPVQQVKDGVVEISVIEGRLGQVNVTVAPDAPITAERVRAFLAAVPVGEAVNAAAYERAMLLLSDQPGIKVTSGLQQGVATGTVDLAVEVVAARRWSFTAEADNHGTLETGRWRLGGTARWNSPAGVGDNLDARLMVSDRGLTFGRLGYELPLGQRPAPGPGRGADAVRHWRRLWSAGRPRPGRRSGCLAQLPGHPPAQPEPDGSPGARIQAPEGRLPRCRRQPGQAGQRRGLGWAWDRRDDWLGGGYFASSGTLYSGHLRIQDAEPKQPTRPRAGCAPRVASRAWCSSSRLQSIAPRHTLYYSIGGQWASKNLDASEKLAWRARRARLRVQRGPGRPGLIQTLEWRWSAMDEITPYLFFDAAHGRQAKRPLSEADNAISLRGAGIGLAWGKPGLQPERHAGLAHRHPARPGRWRWPQPALFHSGAEGLLTRSPMMTSLPPARPQRALRLHPLALALLACGFALPGLAQMLPSGFSTPTGGVSSSVNAAGNVMTIDQSVQRGIANWDTFDRLGCHGQRTSTQRECRAAQPGHR